MNVEYDDCPQYCPKEPKEKQYDIYRRELCKACPRRIKKLEFERATIREFEKWLKPNDLRKVSFEKVFETLKTILAVKDLPPDKMTAKTSILVGVFESEKQRYEKITRDTK